MYTMHLARAVLRLEWKSCQRPHFYSWLPKQANSKTNFQKSWYFQECFFLRGPYCKDEMQTFRLGYSSLFFFIPYWIFLNKTETVIFKFADTKFNTITKHQNRKLVIWVHIKTKDVQITFQFHRILQISGTYAGRWDPLWINNI